MLKRSNSSDKKRTKIAASSSPSLVVVHIGDFRPTVLIGTYTHSCALWAGAHIGVRSHPHLILRPLLQPIQHIAGSIRSDVLHLVALRVFIIHRLVADCVAHDSAVATSGRRRHPTHLDAGGAQAEQVHVLRGGRGGCGRGQGNGEGIKQKLNNSKQACFWTERLGQELRTSLFHIFE